MKIINKSVNEILREGHRHHTNHDKTKQQNRRAWADYKIKNGIQDAERSGISWEDDFGLSGAEVGDYGSITYDNGVDIYDYDDDFEAPPVDFNTNYEICKNYSHDSKPRRRINTHDLEKYAGQLSDTNKKKQMQKIYDEYGNPSQHDRYHWSDGERNTYFFYTPKEHDIKKAWDEHDKLDESIRRAIRKVLR